MRVVVGLTAAVFSPSVVYAVPGPDSVALVANSSVAESRDLADLYAQARSIPDTQRCDLALPTADTIDLAIYEDQLAGPLEDCLSASGALSRVEAVVLMKGVPLRVRVPVADGSQLVSTAAALAAWKSGRFVGGGRVVGSAPGVQADCQGTPCIAAAYANPFDSGVFEAGWNRNRGGVLWRPLIVTMLEGRSYRDAARLVASATVAEAQGPSGTFLFMRGRNPPRSVLDAEFDGIVSVLRSNGLTAEIVDFDNDRVGDSLASLFVGTQTLGDTIEGNDYRPGSLVDNLTSLGAVPRNFEATGESQVSIARWVRQGVAGVHGTVAEPLNNVFPSRRLILDYVEGGTLGEAFFRHMPAAYWRNLVLGDPMAAPYAVRPEVVITGLADGAVVSGAIPLEVSATDPLGRGIASVTLFVDGDELTRVQGDRIDVCWTPPAGTIRLLAVAQVRDDGTTAGFHQPKGWTAFSIEGRSGQPGCGLADAGLPDAAGLADASTEPDQGGPSDVMGTDSNRPDATVGLPDASTPDVAADAAIDAAAPAPSPMSDDGCRCLATETRPTTGLPLGLLVLGLVLTWSARPPRRPRALIP